MSSPDEHGHRRPPWKFGRESGPFGGKEWRSHGWHQGWHHSDHSRWHHGSHHPMRARFFRRAAIAAFVVLLLALSGVLSLSWLVTDKLGLSGWLVPGILALVILIAVLGAARAFRAMRRFALPLRAVMDAAERVAEGDYTTRVSEHGPPPMRALAQSFNTMTTRLQHADRQRRDLMADLAHELRTPLSVLQGRIEGMIDGVYPHGGSELQLLLDQTKVLSRLIEDLRTLALSDAGVLALQREATDIAGLLRDTVRSFHAEATERSVSLRIDEPLPALSLDIDAVRIREVVTNLVSNALGHTPAGGVVRVSAVSAAVSGQGVVKVSVADTGCGMSAEEVARMFERFYKGADSRGSGLGLAIARNLVTAHGGSIEASSTPGQGTTVTFTLR